jgi:hypothetical protein
VNELTMHRASLTFLIRRLPFLVLWVGSNASADVNERMASVRESAKETAWADRPVACYDVPAISPRRRLPDTLPADGRIGDRLSVVAAKGEFESVSFVVFPFVDMAGLKVEGSELKGRDGSIPASAVDVKVVKCWYQGGTAWHSYFADRGSRILTPELLLHDETLIRLDTKTEDNYLRVDYPDGSKYAWISYTNRTDPRPTGVRIRTFFNHATEPVSDSPSLKPVKLEKGQAKQFWVTVKVPEAASPGLYIGSLSLTSGGEEVGVMKMRLRVLPFSLPSPKTYYDLEKDFYTIIYNDCSIQTYLDMNGGDFDQASRKYRAELVNMRDHNCLSPIGRVRYDGRNRKAFTEALKLMKEVGMRTRPLFGWLRGVHPGLVFATRNGGKVSDYQWQQFERSMSEVLSVIHTALGHQDVYPFGWDEPPMWILRAQHDIFKRMHAMGINLISTGHDKHLKLAGYNEDIINYPGWPKKDSARKWHAMGAGIVNYAGPHTGPENPAFIRRTHGIQLYKADYDGTANYKYYESIGGNIWNDFNGAVQYRTFNLVYPTREGVIDTLAWEGYREAIDDIRYATLMRQLAREAIDSGNVDRRYAAKSALLWLANLDETKADLNTMRMEMIRHILQLHRLASGEEEAR